MDSKSQESQENLKVSTHLISSRQIELGFAQAGHQFSKQCFACSVFIRHVWVDCVSQYIEI